MKNFRLVNDLVGSVPALNTIRREKQYMQSPTSSGAIDSDPFTLKNSTKDFRTRCDKVKSRFFFFSVRLEIEFKF